MKVRGRGRVSIFAGALRLLGWLAVVGVISASGVLATPVYNTLVDPSDWSDTRSIGSGLAGTGVWGQPPGGFSIFWLITETTPGTLHYQYTFTWPQGGPVPRDLRTQRGMREFVRRVRVGVPV